MKKHFFGIVLFISHSLLFGQYNDKDGNRIGLSGGLTQTNLLNTNFTVKPGNGFAGGLSVRGNFFDNWSMIYGMQFFANKFSIQSNLNQDVVYSLTGLKIRLLPSYNIIQDHLSFDFGPELQVNDKLAINGSDETKTLYGTSLKANQILEVSKVSANLYFGLSGGGKVVKLLLFYEYGLNNIFNKMNNDPELKTLNNGKTFQGKLGVLNGQILFNL
ncbi:hypothetical protein [Flavobacterium aciduliphilum]|uniref:Outer membrane protein with beta-barrel domain n=1 Tax=Flavobacterium aciduliphilum TaxID=1101402 RepID=A0A328YRZ3_9FLAO|nr:hypothetical protein [Flavobacterium aciduliphilum]RAR72876.1 hypothetical protein CLV55_104136 [Flavobacterium aciduliphilum]